MTTPSYNQTSPASIEEFGKRLVRSTLRKMPGVKEIPPRYLNETPGTQTKGVFGTLVERYYYGIDPGNEACSPDFKEAGVELKTNAIEKRSKGFSAKERLVLQMINYHDIVEESFETSCFMKKSQLMMLISNVFHRDENLVDADIALAQLIDLAKLPSADLEIIRSDWTKIANKIRDGQAHRLSGSDTTYLEACTKGIGGSQRVTQPNGDELARPRAFAFKGGFVTGLVQGSLRENEEFAITDATDVKGRGFEPAIEERFGSFIDLTVKEIEAILGEDLNEAAKGYRATLARRMMNVKKNRIAEFDRAGISLKTILIDEIGRPPESMSFPYFRYMGEGSILEEVWDGEQDENQPEIRRLFEDTRFLFVVYQKKQNVTRLVNVFFWSMPQEDIETYVRPVWQQTFDAIRGGTLQDLPKSSFNQVCHVRPHARNKRDTLPTPHNGEQVKKCFWLDRRYIQTKVREASTAFRE